MSSSDCSSNYILLGNYILDYPEETIDDVITLLKDMKEDSVVPEFAWVVQIILAHRPDSFDVFDVMVHNFLNSEDERMVKHGLEIVLGLMVGGMKMNMMRELLNLRKIVMREIKGEDKEMVRLSLCILLRTLLD